MLLGVSGREKWSEGDSMSERWTVRNSNKRGCFDFVCRVCVGGSLVVDSCINLKLNAVRHYCTSIPTVQMRSLLEAMAC